MGGQRAGDPQRKERLEVEPFRCEEERLETLENFRRYLQTLQGWKDVKRWKAKPEVRDLN